MTDPSGDVDVGECGMLPAQHRCNEWSTRATTPRSHGGNLMNVIVKWMLVASSCLMPLGACGAHHAAGFASDDSSDAATGTPPPADNTGPSGDDSGILVLGEAGPTGEGTNANCKGGYYQGAFEGLYSSGIVGVFLHGPDGGVALNLPVVGNVQLTLHQTGSAQQTCVFQGESEMCSNLFTLQNGTISGTADGLFPYFCRMTGTLDCKARKLVNGWIQCTYCVGFPIVDGGDCLIDTPVSEGKFAGPLVADYFYGVDGGQPSFGTAPLPGVLDGIFNTTDAGKDPGTWNGAESLAGYSGTGPVPGGGTVGDRLSDAGYGRIGVPNDYGGLGFWYAGYCPDGGCPDGG
jgi:hypothetical protein